MAQLRSYGSSVRPTKGLELTAWIFMRLSGVLVLVLALGHWFIMHVFNSVHVIDYDFVAGRYAKLFWRGYDLTLLWLALIHGLNGLRTILDDYLRPPWKGLAARAIWGIGLIFLSLGTWAILAFEPVSGRMM